MKPLLLTALCLLPFASYAQETTANGSLQTEASWTALQSRINATNGNVAILRADVDAILKCNKDGKIWNGKTCISSGLHRWVELGTMQSHGPSLSALENNLVAYAKKQGATRTCKTRLKTGTYPTSYTTQQNSELSGFPCSNEGEACYTLTPYDPEQKDGSPYKHGRVLNMLSCN